MSLKAGKRDIAKLAAVLDAEYDDVDQAAAAVLAAAWEIYENKAKFTVVAQLATSGNEVVDPKDGDKIALGRYGTEKQALDDALKMAYSTQTHETHRAWVLPVHHGTPNEYYVGRKKDRQTGEVADMGYRERELQRRLTWVAENPGHPLPMEWTVEIADTPDTDECATCSGVGRTPKAALTTRGDLPRTWH